jgi:uncharacterized protein YcnI
MIKKITSFLFIIGSIFLFAPPAFAHVVVKPSQVGIAAFQIFRMGVPNEKDSPTVAVRLVIPDGLKAISPNVKLGWTIDEKKIGDGDDAKVTEITWTGGVIPAGQRDDFVFSAQVPSKETTLNWKAYQTYQNGETIAWDHDPKLSKSADDDTAPPPYSMTKVVNDLTGTGTDQDMSLHQSTYISSKIDEVLLWLGALGFGLAVISLGIHMRQK